MARAKKFLARAIRNIYFTLKYCHRNHLTSLQCVYNTPEDFWSLSKWSTCKVGQNLKNSFTEHPFYAILRLMDPFKSIFWKNHSMKIFLFEYIDATWPRWLENGVIAFQCKKPCRPSRQSAEVSNSYPEPHITVGPLQQSNHQITS